ncbi:pyrimidine utilization protein D [Phenylobacterium sp.]|uniref:pyrimidine utilization protein D n=1 Tax=Phenylobacterium sp. TaxID=1871053 RepID=UPI003983BA5C
MARTPSGLCYEVHEGPAHAPAVVLSSGLGGSAAFWSPQMVALGAHFRLVSYDHRGTGRSVRDLTWPHSVQSMADDIVEVMDAAGLASAHVVGHAAGGLAGLALALSAAKRLDRLVVVNGWAAPDPHIRRCFDTRLSLLNDSGPRAYVHAQPLFLYPANWISENAARLAAEEAHHVADFPSLEVMRARIVALLAFDIADRLSDIAHRVLVAASADDMLVPLLCSRRLAAGLPKASLEIAPWGGHAYTVTAPDDFNATLLRFLRDDPRTDGY